MLINSHGLSIKYGLKGRSCHGEHSANERINGSHRNGVVRLGFCCWVVGLFVGHGKTNDGGTSGITDGPFHFNQSSLMYPITSIYISLYSYDYVKILVFEGISKKNNCSRYNYELHFSIWKH